MQIREARLEVVAELFKKGYTRRQIREEVMRRMGLPTYALSAVQKDVQRLLDEWRRNRLADTDTAIQLELERIDDALRELWAQWEKSKGDYTRVEKKQKGAPIGGSAKEGEDPKMRTFAVEKKSLNVVGLGDTSYMTEIRQQLIERRKLLGLYAPERREVKGDVTVLRSPCDMTTEEIEAEIKSLKLDEEG